MIAVTINIPDSDLDFCNQVIARMGWSYGEPITEQKSHKQETLESINRAFAEFKQIQEGKLQSINAEDLLNEL